MTVIEILKASAFAQRAKANASKIPYIQGTETQPVGSTYPTSVTAPAKPALTYGK